VFHIWKFSTIWGLDYRICSIDLFLPCTVYAATSAISQSKSQLSLIMTLYLESSFLFLFVFFSLRVPFRETVEVEGGLITSSVAD
jgi:predicted permease